MKHKTLINLPQVFPYREDGSTFLCGVSEAWGFLLGDKWKQKNVKIVEKQKTLKIFVGLKRDLLREYFFVKIVGVSGLSLGMKKIKKMAGKEVKGGV